MSDVAKEMEEWFRQQLDILRQKAENCPINGEYYYGLLGKAEYVEEAVLPHLRALIEQPADGELSPREYRLVDALHALAEIWHDPECEAHHLDEAFDIIAKLLADEHLLSVTDKMFMDSEKVKLQEWVDDLGFATFHYQGDWDGESVDEWRVVKLPEELESHSKIIAHGLTRWLALQAAREIVKERGEKVDV